MNKPIAVELPAGSHHVCTCARSNTLPFCDGSHEGTPHTPQAVEMDKAGKVWVCACKRTLTPPFCDGSHKH